MKAFQSIKPLKPEETLISNSSFHLYEIGSNRKQVHRHGPDYVLYQSNRYSDSCIILCEVTFYQIIVLLHTGS